MRRNGDEIQVCSSCGRDLPSDRLSLDRVSICVWCILEEKQGKKIATIPGMRYNSGR